jgi:hypothetical protein
MLLVNPYYVLILQPLYVFLCLDFCLSVKCVAEEFRISGKTST